LTDRQWATRGAQLLNHFRIFLPPGMHATAIVDNTLILGKTDNCHIAPLEIIERSGNNHFAESPTRLIAAAGKQGGRCFF
jgi:hypothetical protein